MATINTVEDILNALGRDESLLRQVRSVILTNDLLALPNQFQDSLKTQNQLLDTQNQLLRRVENVENVQRQLLRRVENVEAVQTELLATQNQILARLEKLETVQNQLLRRMENVEKVQNQLLDTQNQILGRLEKLETVQNQLLRRVENVENVQSQLLSRMENVEAVQTELLATQNELLRRVENVEKVQAEMLATQRQLLDTQNQLLRRVENVEAVQTELLATQNELLRRMNNVETRLDRMDHDFSNFRGNYAETVARKHAWTITLELAEEKGVELSTPYKVEILNAEDLHDIADKDDFRKLSSAIRRSYLNSDLTIRSMTSEEEPIYIVAEASYTCDERDSSRALAHSERLRQYTGAQSFAAVAGVRLDRNIQPLIDSGRIFWYRLSEDELKP